MNTWPFETREEYRAFWASVLAKDTGPLAPVVPIRPERPDTDDEEAS